MGERGNRKWVVLEVAGDLVSSAAVRGEELLNAQLRCNLRLARQPMPEQFDNLFKLF